MDRVPVLTTRQREPRQPFANAHVALHILGEQVILQPLDAVRTQRLAQPDGILDVQRDPGIDHELHVWPNLLARARYKLLAAPDAFDACLGALPQEDLDGLEAQLEEPRDTLLGAVGEIGVARVAGNALLLRATEKLVDGPPEQLALEVPEGDVHRADGVARQSSGAIGSRDAAQDVPELLRGHTVLAGQHRRKMAVDDLSHRRAVIGEAGTERSVLSCHHHRHTVPARRPAGAWELRVALHRAGKAIGRLPRCSRRCLRVGGQVHNGRTNILDLHRRFFLRSHDRTMTAPERVTMGPEATTDGAAGRAMALPNPEPKAMRVASGRR